MAELKAGSINDFANSMAAKMEAAMQEEWRLAYGQSLPGTGDRDRMILFAAVAKGVLRYLHEHRNDLLTSYAAHTTGYHRHDVEFVLREPG